MKDLRLELSENMDKATMYSVMPYEYNDFRHDCKTYIKALKTGRLVFVDKHKDIMSVDMFTRAYKGTTKKLYYKSYNSMLITLGFDEILDGVQLPKDVVGEILTRIYELGFIKESKYKKLKDTQIYNSAY